MKHTFREFDVVALRHDLVRHDITRGAPGTIVHIFDEPTRAYLVEFADGDGREILTEAFRADDLIPWTPESL